MEVGRKRRGFFTCTKNRRGEQVTYVFLNKDLVLLRFKLGPEWAGTISGDRLVLGLSCFTVQGCVIQDT